MDELSEIIAYLVDGTDVEPMVPKELEARGTVLRELFKYYRETDLSRLELYVHETAEIPLDKLAIGIKAILRSRPWPSLPAIAELWRAARIVSGMHREQYHAGHYLPPPRDWPPTGKRHAIHVHEFEQIDISKVPVIGPGNNQVVGMIGTGEASNQ